MSLQAKSAKYYQAEAERLRHDADLLSKALIKEQLLSIAASYDGPAQTVNVLRHGRANWRQLAS
jgi:hypothetical protein